MTSSNIVGKKTYLKCLLSKPLAYEEFLPGFWDQCSEPPRVIYVTSLPRSGSTVTKRFLGDHPSISLTGMSPSHNWWDAWCRQRLVSWFNKVVLDKRTLYIHHLETILSTFGRHVKILLVIRDPRDELASLMDFDRHQSVPRDESFYDYWLKTYRRALNVLTDQATKNDSKLLRYEDLAQHPEVIKSYFLKWIGLRETNTNNYYRTACPSIARSSSPNEDRKTHQQSTITDTSVGRWRDVSSLRRDIIDTYSRKQPLLRSLRKLDYLPQEDRQTEPNLFDPEAVIDGFNQD